MQYFTQCKEHQWGAVAARVNVGCKRCSEDIIDSYVTDSAACCYLYSEKALFGIKKINNIFVLSHNFDTSDFRNMTIENFCICAT